MFVSCFLPSFNSNPFGFSNSFIWVPATFSDFNPLSEILLNIQKWCISSDWFKKCSSSDSRDLCHTPALCKTKLEWLWLRSTTLEGSPSLITPKSFPILTVDSPPVVHNPIHLPLSIDRPQGSEAGYVGPVIEERRESAWAKNPRHSLPISAKSRLWLLVKLCAFFA
jgi:hypothetical protein